MSRVTRLALILLSIFTLSVACKDKGGDSGGGGGGGTSSDQLPNSDAWNDDSNPSSNECEEQKESADEAGLNLIAGSLTKFALAGDDVYYEDKIKDMLESDCISCHAADSKYGEFHTFDLAAKAADEIAEAVADGSMPPSGELSAGDVEAYLTWAKNDAPKAASNDDDQDENEGDLDDDENDDTDTLVKDDCEDEDDLEGHNESDDGHDDETDEDIVSTDLDDLLKPARLKECHDKDKVYDRIARDCHIADIATTYECDKAGAKKAFEKIGVKLGSVLDDLLADEFEFDQCGEYQGDPVVMFTKVKKSGGSYKLGVRKLCKKGSPACGGDDVADTNKGPGQYYEDFKTNTKFFKANKELLETTAHPGGTDANIWYSANIVGLIGKDKLSAPIGTVAIKEFKAGTETMQTVMVKEANGWVYSKRDSNGDVVDNDDGDPMEGQLAGCIGCHENAKDLDYLPYADKAVVGQDGPGLFISSFKTSSLFWKATTTTLATTAHPGGTDADIWYSKNIRHLLGRTGYTVPDGTVAIKEFKNADAAIMRTVMIKKNGAWEYDKRNQFGTVNLDNGQPARGQLAGCIGCHGDHQDSDFLPYLKHQEAGDDGATNNDDNDEGPGRFYADFKNNDLFFKASPITLDTSNHPGATNANIWYSSNMRDLVGKPRLTAPEGSVAIKEFQAGGNTMLTVMVKKNGDWEYNKRDENDTVNDADGNPMIGDLAGCKGCHDNYANTDKLPFAQDANP